MRRVHAELQSNGVRYDVVAEISAYTDKQKKKAKEKPPIDNGPTRERLAKGDLMLITTYNAQGFEDGNQYQVCAYVDVAKKYIEEGEVKALETFARNAEFARRFRSVTSSYEGMTGTAYGPRHGGLPDVVRESASVHDWMMEKLHSNWRDFANKLYWAILREKEGNPLTSREIVAHFFPNMVDKGRRDGCFIAMVRAFSWRLQELEQELQNAIKGETRGGETLTRIVGAERIAKEERKKGT
jgi:hypothetical protein